MRCRVPGLGASEEAPEIAQGAIDYADRDAATSRGSLTNLTTAPSPGMTAGILSPRPPSSPDAKHPREHPRAPSRPAGTCRRMPPDAGIAFGSLAGEEGFEPSIP